jgi:hypothetical protein
MSKISTLLGVFAMTASLGLSAQNVAVIDLNERSQPFSKADYDTLLSCTLRAYPEETRRYAEYHLLRRNNQSVERNEADPDSKLMMKAIGECFSFGNGKAIPFSLDALIGDWGKAHDVYARAGRPGPMGFANAEELAACALTHHRAIVNEMLLEARPMGALRYLSQFVGPQCYPQGSERLDIDRFYAAIDKKLEQGGATE